MLEKEAFEVEDTVWDCNTEKEIENKMNFIPNKLWISTFLVKSDEHRSKFDVTIQLILNKNWI